MSRYSRIAVVSLSLLIFSYIGLGYLLAKTDDDKAYRSLNVYGEVLQRVQEDYVDEPNLSNVTAGALHGLLESLDPFSGYLSPREYADFKEKQKSTVHGEIGATLAKRFGYVVVVSVLPDSPAEKAGLRSGDIVEEIADFTTREMSIGQANSLLAGAPGTTIKVGLVRRGKTEPQAITITRAVIPALHLTADKIDDGVGYVRISALQTGAAAELRDKLQQFDKQGLHKLVLDLRDCARGPASEGIAAAQLLIPSGTIATLKGQTVSRQEFDADPDKVVWHGPVEVLISPSTSGAAEIIAAAIGDDHRGDVVGVRSFGAASEQKLIPLEDGSAIMLTVAYYYTPANKSILENGVAPSVEVVSGVPPEIGGDDLAPAPLGLNQLPPKDDPVVRKALDLLNNGARKAA
jgi:carboxyl-terminal processing protease